jgi:hypothetical protein
LVRVSNHDRKKKDKSGIHTLPIPEENHKEFAGIDHISLMHEPRVYEQIKEWNYG